MPAGIAAVGSAAIGSSLILAGPALALALVGGLLIGLWWVEGARNGRRLREAVLGAVALAVTANLISSWLGSVGGVPAGALLRDLAFLIVVVAAIGETTADGANTARIVAYAALAAAVLAAIDTAGGLPAFVGARTYLLYPLLLLAAAWRMPAADRLAVIRAIVALLAALAVIGLLEVATRGRFLTTIGFVPDFAETNANNASPYFAGFRRATGGLGNFLEFGLLMNIGLLLTRASLRGPARLICMVLFSVAAFLSWSRLSWVLILVIAALPLGLIDEGRVRFRIRAIAGTLAVGLVAGLLLAFGPNQAVTDRIFGSDRVTQRSNVTREAQLSEAFTEGAKHLIGAGPGTQGAAADRQEERVRRLSTDNGYLIWLLELGWLGLLAIAALSAAVAMALFAARAWWALALLGVLAASNALFAAADSRVVLVISFIALRLLWTAPEEDETPDRVVGRLETTPQPALSGSLRSAGAAATAPAPAMSRPTPSATAPRVAVERMPAALSPPPQPSAVPSEATARRSIAPADQEAPDSRTSGSKAGTKATGGRSVLRRFVLFMVLRAGSRARRGR
jgi:hypothetical protein